jgi:hypothetical protein
MGKQINTCMLAALVALGIAAPASAVELADLGQFPGLFGRYGPAGDCSRHPQVLVDRSGFALETGPGKAERVPALDYAPGYFGPAYEGIATAFLPHWPGVEGSPFLLVVNEAEREGALVVEPHDLGWPGGPPMPARFKPWLAGSPYARCAGS